ncbi:MAG: HEPN domain containing protein [Candidatus Methanohalarchaeum thermophilum]|uniref:HEPN domain containing protein n=1 Tax=Methanohalarchaeum thermophilum TaxID=1903181 RepID=A0A1Q6DT94_METT1|nr:MAG: HEPN domain containing protein [Candidatus Methanohalarchaeum thermophilum]
MKNELVQDAVIRQLEIIGEASKKLSDDFRSKDEEIEWRDIAGMRDKLIHGYFGVDLEIVWETINNELPKLKKEVQEKI